MALCSCFIPVGLITRPARTQGQGRGHAWTHARAQWGCKQAGTDSVAERLRCVGGASVATLAFSACVLVNGTPHQAGNHLSPAEPSVGVVCGTFHTGAYVCLRSRRSRSPPGGCEQARPPAKREHATHRCCRLPDTRRGESKAQSRRRHVCCQSLPLEHCRTPAQEDRLKRELTNMERDTGIKLRVLAQNYPETPGLAGLQHLCPFCLRAIRSATRVAQVPDSAHM